MTMEEAGVHVNYWCAAEATYQVTDGRTVSADTMFKSAYGRCGEESVYAVTIYRSVGIPARQVHVPLWSHCDDNHAWVEIWVDGVWKFLGACEPEEILNKSWFTTASSRAMMVQSRWFLPALPKEDIIGNTGMAQVLNQLNTYAYSMKLEVLVQDADGNTEYYQVSWSVRDESTRKRELAPLDAISDHNLKTLLTMDNDPPVSYNGIRQKYVLDWLLGK